MIYKNISGFSDEIDENIEKQFSVLNKLGISYFEARGINGKNISTLTDDEISMLIDNMNKFNIKISSVGSPIGKVYIEDDFSEHFELFKRVVDIAKKLNSKYIRMFSFYTKDNVWTSEKRDEVFKRLKDMILYAKENDIILLHENEKAIYGDTLSRCLDLMENLSCDNFKACFDSANFVQSGQDCKECYDKLKNYIEYIHIKDAISETGNVVPAGYGDGCIEYILKNHIENGYNGYISLEPHLGNFTGLGDLELDDKMEKLEKGGEGTFTLAYNSLSDILNKINM